MPVLDVARWQFGITTIYHFLFVPLTIGLSLVVAVLQTAWCRTGDERWLRQTKFWGKFFLVNFAMGVVTGIVQEFQFGMAWAGHSRDDADAAHRVPLGVRARGARESCRVALVAVSVAVSVEHHGRDNVAPCDATFARSAASFASTVG